MLSGRVADASESKPDWSKSVAVSCDPAMTYGFNLTSSLNINLPLFLLAYNNYHKPTHKKSGASDESSESTPNQQLVRVLGTKITRRNGLILAAALSMAIGPITGIMLPICNDPLREMAELERQVREKEIDEEELKKMVKRFEWLNYLLGVPILIGGMLGLAVIASQIVKVK